MLSYILRVFAFSAAVADHLILLTLYLDEVSPDVDALLRTESYDVASVMQRSRRILSVAANMWFNRPV